MTMKSWLPKPGEQIANTRGTNYVIGKRLGHGGFGAVHECRAASLRVPCVAKFAKPEGLIEDVQQRWETECQLMSLVYSPHIIQLFDYFRYRNVFWMIMERAGGTLRDEIRRRGPLTDEQTILASTHLLKALQELNDKDIVHRDLHIDNILYADISNVRYLKIADFGIATRLLTPTAVASTRIGRAYDVAPDLHLVGYSTHRSDLYQVGLAMYFMLQGVEALGPSDGHPKAAILKGIARKRAEQIGTPLGDYIAVLLRRREQYRYQDADEALAELAGIAPAHGIRIE